MSREARFRDGAARRARRAGDAAWRRLKPPGFGAAAMPRRQSGGTPDVAQARFVVENRVRNASATAAGGSERPIPASAKKVSGRFRDARKYFSPSVYRGLVKIRDNLSQKIWDKPVYLITLADMSMLLILLQTYAYSNLETRDTSRRTSMQPSTRQTDSSFLQHVQQKQPVSTSRLSSRAK